MLFVPAAAGKNTKNVASAVNERSTGVWNNTVPAALRKLEELGIVRELSHRGRRNMLFGYERYISILNEGTEPVK